jgi:hypothetical protein
MKKIVARISDIEWSMEVEEESMPISLTYIIRCDVIAEEIIKNLKERMHRDIMRHAFSYDVNCIIYKDESSSKYDEMNISVRWDEITDVFEINEP